MFQNKIIILKMLNHPNLKEK